MLFITFLFVKATLNLTFTELTFTELTFTEVALECLSHVRRTKCGTGTNNLRGCGLLSDGGGAPRGVQGSQRQEAGGTESDSGRYGGGWAVLLPTRHHLRGQRENNGVAFPSGVHPC